MRGKILIPSCWEYVNATNVSLLSAFIMGSSHQAGKHYTSDVILDEKSLSRGIFPINEPLSNTKIYQNNFVITFSSY